MISVICAALAAWLLVGVSPLRRVEPPPPTFERPGWEWLRDRLWGRDGPRTIASEQPDALDFLAVCLRAGATPIAAARTVADVSPDATASLLRGVSAHLEVGRTPEEAWGSLAEHPVWGAAARDLVRSSRSGTTLIDVLHTHAEDARAAAHDAHTKRAKSVGVKSVLPLMACFLPAFILIGVVPIIGALIERMLA